MDIPYFMQASKQANFLQQTIETIFFFFFGSTISDELLELLN
jgi:preprotein translocase subunit SecG